MNDFLQESHKDFTAFSFITNRYHPIQARRAGNEQHHLALLPGAESIAGITIHRREDRNNGGRRGIHLHQEKDNRGVPHPRGRMKKAGICLLSSFLRFVLAGNSDISSKNTLLLQTQTGR